MTENRLKNYFIEQQGYSANEAELMIAEATMEISELIADGLFDEAYSYCADNFGLEPDYLDDLIL